MQNWLGPAVLLLTHVNYHTGRMHDMTALTRAAHGHGTLVIWDLAHSAGVVPLALSESDSPEARTSPSDVAISS